MQIRWLQTTRLYARAEKRPGQYAQELGEQKRPFGASQVPRPPRPEVDARPGDGPACWTDGPHAASPAWLSCPAAVANCSSGGLLHPPLRWPGGGWRSEVQARTPQTPHAPGPHPAPAGVGNEALAELEVLAGFDDDLAGEATRIRNRICGLLRKDEGVLFDIANNFALRH
ncbi:hypothetical protein EIY87_22260 [Amycolatopsis eburnea]|uniref:Uncharacterized protein n=1 Tax=Amycolatopsis eburnea TaxID=2267691 RepID=A0A427T7N1_9PSEU|nr:hypothetical protein EIY87_22260 [Amycolatopsis eburnea]